MAAEPSAAPFHDWNQRIDQECYRAVTAARLPGPDGRIARIVNALQGMSFNFGSTLFTWMEREAAWTYELVLEADRASHARLGYGNAIAMPYHHVILPLCSRRDKTTEVRWGIRDFQRRFNREPEGMWLPETAVDEETLSVLAAEGIRFTVVGPSQVTKPPAGGLPGRFRGPMGRSVAVFVYDGSMSHDVAFGELVRDATLWRDRMVLAARNARLVSLAMDGETFGHHHKFGEMALASVLDRLAAMPTITVENFASFLARHPATEDVEIVSPSSWSCPHGVERWRSDCGCRIAPQLPTNQKWRAPLRTSLDWLVGELDRVFEKEGAGAIGDPWAARDAAGPVAGEDTAGLGVRARELIEMQRNALAMFTSCGWFFDDVGGVETVVVLRHAARAIELSGDDGRLEAGLLARLAAAKSNDPGVGDGALVHRVNVMRALKRVAPAAAGYAAAEAVAPGMDAQLPGYALSSPDALGGAVRVEDRRTGTTDVVQVTVERPGLCRVDLAANGMPLEVKDLPERQRLVIQHAMIRAVVEWWFAPHERDLLSTGTASLAEVASLALTRAVGALAHDQSETALHRAQDLVDLAGLLGRTIPFDAQTRFARLRFQVPAGEYARLAPLGPRLGLAT